jgi:alpha-aminoadipate/glutamate carrier protein LysW
LTPALYNTTESVRLRKERLFVTRCPECDTEIDLDEDEVEEGEIVSCPECDKELEVTQTHPVHLIAISDDEDDDDEDEEAEEKSIVDDDEEEDDDDDDEDDDE